MAIATPNKAGYGIRMNSATVNVTIAGDQRTTVLQVSRVSILKLLLLLFLAGCAVLSDVVLFEAAAEDLIRFFACDIFQTMKGYPVIMINKASTKVSST